MDTVLIKNTILLSCGLLIAGCTTLHTAASKGNVKAIERLVKEEANIDETDSSGKTPLMYAVILNQKESVVTLLKAGADVNAQSYTGNTALHEAIMQGNIKFGSLLLDHGANTGIRNKDGKNALDLAKEKGSQPFIDLVTAHGNAKKDPVVVKPVIEVHVASSSPVDMIEPIPVIVQAPVTVPIVDKIPQESLKTKTPTISNEEAMARLRKMIAGRETLGIRSFLNQYPDAIQFIEDPMQRIRYVGPSGFRVIDIIENTGRGKMNDMQVASQIISANLPYKVFSADELKMLSRYGISNTITDAMVKVSK